MYKPEPVVRLNLQFVNIRRYTDQSSEDVVYVTLRLLPRKTTNDFIERV